MQRDCARLTEEQFKPIHAFYVSMLALRYRTPRGDRIIWPNQCTWLLQQHLIEWKDHERWGLSVENIRDKSKADSVAKLIALVQVSWFVVACILRSAHALPLAQLESMTLGYIPLFVVTYFFWWDKPKDIRSPSVIDLPDMSSEQQHEFESMAVSNKFDDEGKLTYWNIWYLTPRVFEKEEEDRLTGEARAKAAERAERHAAKRAMENQKEKLDPKALPTITTGQSDFRSPTDIKIKMRKEIVISHWDPYLYRSRLWLVTCLFGASFGALHLIAWDTVFPTDVEMWLWRAAAIVSIASLLVFMHFEKIVLRWDSLISYTGIVSAGLYIISRILMMVEVFAALRAEDPGIYCTYEVSTYWIHLL